MLKNKKILTLMLTTESAEHVEDLNTSLELFIFLIRYSFLLTNTPAENIFFKRDFPPPGELFSQNSNGARYLDPKYSRWISVDPALGEYVPAAGKSNEADKLPGMGGIFNSVNLSLYHYAGNNPVKYIDPDGREDIKYIIGQDILDQDLSFTVDEEINYNITIASELKCNITENRRELSMSFKDSLCLGGIFNIYRKQEKDNAYNIFAENYSNACTIRDMTFLLGSYFGMEVALPVSALLFAVDLGIGLFKPKQYEKAADQIASFQQSIIDYEKKGYTLDGDITISSWTKTLRARRPFDKPDIIDLHKEITLRATMINSKTSQPLGISIRIELDSSQ